MVRSNLQNKVENIDWDFENAETQYLTHAIHRYSGKFIPQIAQQAINLITKPGDLVLDPYCGSGTTLVECSLSGRRSIGIDLNPLAVLISKTKVTPVEMRKLQAFVKEVDDYARPLVRKNDNLDLFDELECSHRELVEIAYQDFRWQDPWYKKWFADDIRAELIILHQKISTFPCTKCRNIGLTAFSDILRKSSNANGSYPNVMFDKNKVTPPLPTPRFIERLWEISRAVGQLEFTLNCRPIPTVLRANANHLPIRDNSVDAIITHPPYIGSIPYAEYGLLSLVWLGYDPKSLDRTLTGGKRQSKDVIDRFKDDFGRMFVESWRVLKPGKILFILVGNPTVKDKRVDLSEMAKELAFSVGFELQASHRRNGINRRANFMERETLLFFRKSRV
jgi:site-specific DNA-methyltransferase (cytosine-N4-specific)